MSELKEQTENIDSFKDNTVTNTFSYDGHFNVPGGILGSLPIVKRMDRLEYDSILETFYLELTERQYKWCISQMVPGPENQN